MNLGGRDFKCRDEGEGVSYEASRLWNPRPKTDLVLATKIENILFGRSSK